jgi:FlgD Ig-like domain
MHPPREEDFMRRPHRAAGVAVLLFLALSPISADAAWPHLSSTNLSVSTSTFNQFNPLICSDTKGGAFVLWSDARTSGSTGTDLYAQHILATGVIDPAWPATDLPVCTAVGEQNSAVMIADGAGGFYAAWVDGRSGTNLPYGIRVQANGTNAAGWPANGLLLSNSGRAMENPAVALDDAGGVYFAWDEQFVGVDFDPFVQRLTGSGAQYLGFGSQGKDLNLDTHTQRRPKLIRNDLGSVFVLYEDNSGGNYDLRCALVGPTATIAFDELAGYGPGDQTNAVGCEDGAHGMYFAWYDTHANPQGDVVVNVMAPDGALSTLNFGWFLTNTALDTETPTSLVSDGNGGAFLGYQDQASNGVGFDLVHLGTTGLPTSAFVQISFSEGGHMSALVADGYGNAIVAAGSSSDMSLPLDMLAWKMTTAGSSTPEGWSATGNMVSIAQGVQDLPAATTDGSGGAIVVWQDNRANLTTPTHIYAQRIERFGRLGNPEPSIVGIKDVKNDQGGHVRIEWLPSYLDIPVGGSVSSYRVWRQVPAAQIAGMTARQKTIRSLRTTMSASAVYFWEQIGSVSALGLSGYSFVAATTGDSIGASNPYTVFAVDASSYISQYWMSSPDSGYSVDNIPPVAPAPFTATYAPPNGAFMAWGADAEPDLAGYRLYRGGGLGFVPSPANRIYDGQIPSYHDVVSTPYIYKVCAYDVHGNEGGCTTAQPAGTLGAETSLPAELELAPITPNPSSGSEMLRFGLPRDGVVSLAIYDAQGRRVRTLLSGMQSAGWIEARWDGRDESGSRAASGLYFVKLEGAGRTLSQRFVRLD